MPSGSRPPLPPDVTPADIARLIVKLRAEGKHEQADFLLSYLPPADPFGHLDAPPPGFAPNGGAGGSADTPPAPTANQGGLAISGPPAPPNSASEGSLPPKIDKADGLPGELSCVYLPLPEPIRGRVLALGKMLTDADAIERDDSPHTTAFFGLHDADPTSAFEVLSHFRPVRLTFGKASVFHRPEHDVVKLDVESDQLRRLNAELRNLPHTSEFPNFAPHVTIAYVTPGKGPYYADLINGVSALPGTECVCHLAVFSDKDRVKHVYPLGKKIVVEKAMSYLSGGAGGELVAPASFGRPIRLKRNRKIKRVLKDALADILPAGYGNLFFPLTSSALDPEAFVFGTKAFDATVHPRETTAHDGKRPGEFAPKGEGAGAAPAERGRVISGPRARTFAEAAAEIPFTDELVASESVEPGDWGVIESRMTDDERKQFESYLDKQADEWAKDELKKYDPDEDITPDVWNKLVEEAGWSSEDIAWKAIDAIKEYVEAASFDDPEGVINDAEKDIDSWYDSTSLHGVEAIEELAKEMRDNGWDSDAVKAIRDLANDAERDIDEAAEEKRDELRDEKRESLKEDYSDSREHHEDERDYLRDFYDEHKSEPRFAGSSVFNVWGKDDDGDAVYKFQTSKGAKYTVNIFSGAYGGQAVPELTFQDQDGSYAVTGAGGAHEVFGKVVPAVLAYVAKKNLPMLSFSAAEESRQKLYDRLVWTVATVNPQYTAMTISAPGDTRRYVVVRRDKKEEFNDMLNKFALEHGPDLKVETLVKSYAPSPRPTVQVLPPATEQQMAAWLTPAGWSMSSAAKAFDSREVAKRAHPLNRCNVSNISPRSKRKLTDDQWDLLRTLAEHFLDGIVHLLDNQGSIPKDRAAQTHAENDQTRQMVQEDVALSNEAKELPVHDHWQGKIARPEYASPSAVKLNDEHLSRISDVYANLPFDPEHDADGPQPDDYAGHDDFMNDSDQWARQSAETSGAFRAGMGQGLSEIAYHARKALGHPIEDYHDLFGAEEGADHRAKVEQIHRKATELLSRLRPKRQPLFDADGEAAAVEKGLNRRKWKPHPNQAAIAWDEEDHPRESTAHDGKRPGEFAPKSEEQEPAPVDSSFATRHNSDVPPGGEAAEPSGGGDVTATPEAKEAKQAKPHEATAEKFGRTLRGDGKPLFYRTFLGHGKRAEIERRGVGREVGDVFDSKQTGGPMLVVSVDKPDFVSDDHIEDMDAWSDYKDGAGWYADYTAVPVNETADEAAARKKKEAEAKAQAAAEAAKRKESDDKWSDVSKHPEVHSLPGGLPELKWETVSSEYGQFGRGTTTYSIATLPTGEKIGRKSTSTYDDRRESYFVPKHLLESPEAVSAKAVQDAKSTADFDRLAHEHYAKYRKLPSGETRTMMARRNQAKQHGAHYPEAVREIVHSHPDVKATLDHYAASGDEAALAAYKDRATELGEEVAATRRNAYQSAHEEWHPRIAAEFGQDTADEIAADVKNYHEQVTHVNPAVKFEDGYMLEKEERAKKEAAAKRRADTVSARKNDPLVTVSGNTYPHRDTLERIPGSKLSKIDGRWVWKIPKSQAGKLPRGLSV